MFRKLEDGTTDTYFKKENKKGVLEAQRATKNDS